MFYFDNVCYQYFYTRRKCIVNFDALMCTFHLFGFIKSYNLGSTTLLFNLDFIAMKMKCSTNVIIGMFL